MRLVAKLLCVFTLSGLLVAPVVSQDSTINLQLRSQKETSTGSMRYHRTTREESWQAKETAVIVCDVWDSHH